MENVHAIEFINSFICKSKKNRLFSILNSKAGIISFISHLNHLGDFDEKFIVKIPFNDFARQKMYIISFVKEKYKQNICYVISENRTINGLDLNINDAVDAVVGKPYASFISFIPGRLAYFESESINSGLILHKD